LIHLLVCAIFLTSVRVYPDAAGGADLPSARNNKYIQRFVEAFDIYGGNKKATKIFSGER